MSQSKKTSTWARSFKAKGTLGKPFQIVIRPAFEKEIKVLFFL